MRCRYTLYVYKDGHRDSATDYPTKQELEQAFDELKAKYNAVEDEKRSAEFCGPTKIVRFADGFFNRRSLGLEYFEDLNALTEEEELQAVPKGWKLVKYDGRRPS